jgi:hypothetical protein
MVPQLLDSALRTTHAPWTDHKRQILLDTLRILIQRSLGARGSACSVPGQRSLLPWCWFAHRICQAIVYSLGPGDKPFSFWVLQVVFYFVFDSLPSRSRALNLALP